MPTDQDMTAIEKRACYSQFPRGRDMLYPTGPHGEESRSVRGKWRGGHHYILCFTNINSLFEALSGRISQLSGRPSLLLFFPYLHNPVLDCDTHQASLASVCVSLESCYHNSSLMRRPSSGWDSFPQCPMDGPLQTWRQGRQPCLNRELTSVDAPALRDTTIWLYTTQN